ncbi:MAG: CoA transferase [Dehalococcoidales bacterium]|nr:CoA transferase [Dehalococcoidales bacterium]
MNEANQTEGLLSPYRILDLTNERGFLCGKLLGDLGADVIKIEKPGGDPARRLGPFYRDIPRPENSLFWWGFNSNKRGITLDIETVDGQDIFKKLVKRADFVLESFEPGYLEKLGLGYEALSQINPGIVLTSITSFGQTGPYKDFQSTDLVLWALSGVAYVTGDPEGAPLMPSFPIAYLFASTCAAIGTLTAGYQRNLTGEGQHVDAPGQLSLALASGPEVQGLWEVDKIITKRSGKSWMRAQSGGGSDGIKYVKIPIIYQCKDGCVRFFPFVETGCLPSTNGLTRWVIEEGAANDALKNVDWRTWNWEATSQQAVDEITQCLSNFFMQHTKAELWEGAQKRGIMLYPLLTPSDMMEFEQLNARGFWEEVEHPELGTSFAYPGAYIKLSEAPIKIRRRAPLIGEHNEEIYVKDLGLSFEDLLILKQAKVI